ncbi:MAG TPA: NUDIX hydrolase, partial [Thermoanaerobaculia bacterium]|nr:NUDIX hydrolase [Thermoanaerobaculia bacterium]
MTSTNVRDDQLPLGAGDAAEVTPRPAASVLLFRRDSLDLLMMRRHEGSSFVPGAWVFPGGVVEPLDRELTENELDAIRLCAIRELFEETGIYLGKGLANSDDSRAALAAGATTFREVIATGPVALDQLVLVSHWVTPVGVPKRFD